uniref:Uncharacterized protein n=1 Tax=Anguilla anguilla TaxID=7936 RepID=A0A0E9VB18_ANGAN
MCVVCDGHSNTFTFVVFKPFCYKFGGMLRIIQLEDPVATEF